MSRKWWAQSETRYLLALLLVLGQAGEHILHVVQTRNTVPTQNAESDGMNERSQPLYTPFEASVLLEEVVEIPNELVDCLSHVHMANISINGIRVRERHGGVFVCSHSGLELVSTHLSHEKPRFVEITHEYFVPSSIGSKSLLIAWYVNS